MTASIRITRAGPLCTIQDDGRHGLLSYGISASGPMDRTAHYEAGELIGAVDTAGIEFTRAGLDLEVIEGRLGVGWAGGGFSAKVNQSGHAWPGKVEMLAGDRLSITPGPQGNYGYLRFDRHMALQPVLHSRATSTRARIGGLEGRSLLPGDVMQFGEKSAHSKVLKHSAPQPGGEIRFVWGIHAEYFSHDVRQRFADNTFRITPMLDRMGVRLADLGGVFSGASILSLVSDPIMPGDIQILGDGTPIVLMRDHQPTGGYPRIGTIISADLDRFAQLRPGADVAFSPVSVEHAHRLLRGGQP